MKKFKEFLNKPVFKKETIDKAAKIGYGIAITSLCVCAVLTVIDKAGDK